MKALLSICSLALIFWSGFAYGSGISAVDILTTKTVSVTPAMENKKGMVVVFVSAVCPCSQSHLQELKDLSRDYPEFSFVGVHSNSDEMKTPTTEYFRAAALPFPVVQDPGSKIADEFKALKTPHAFVVGRDGKILYQGGVSSSRNFARADKKFLRLALEDLKAGREVAVKEGRTLGCVIKRGDKNDW